MKKKKNHMNTKEEEVITDQNIISCWQYKHKDIMKLLAGDGNALSFIL